MPTIDRGAPSPHDQCLEGARTAIRALKLEGCPEQEIQVRDAWHNGDQPHRGITLSDGGEDYKDGVIGFEDVGYVVTCTMATLKDRSATAPTARIRLWRSVIRRRFQNQRIPTGMELAGGVIRSVCRVGRGQPSIPRSGKFKDYDVDQLLIVFWVRERPDNGE